MEVPGPSQFGAYLPGAQYHTDLIFAKCKVPPRKQLVMVLLSLTVNSFHSTPLLPLAFFLLLSPLFTL